MKTCTTLLLLAMLGACDADDELAPAPDAAPAFCNPLREECGFCGVEGSGCCLNPHDRPEDTRAQYYCIDGSQCAYTGTNWLFTCLAPAAVGSDQ